jgi:hypothetical protein
MRPVPGARDRVHYPSFRDAAESHPAAPGDPPADTEIKERVAMIGEHRHRRCEHQQPP